jgi:hypothetical protein
MALFDFFKKRQSPPPSVRPRPAPTSATIAPPSNPGTTRIEREHFLLHAPFEWKAVPPTKELEYEFRNQALPEQLIVTVLLTREAMDASRRRSVVQDLTNTRLRAIGQLSSGRAQHSPPQQNEGDGQCEMRCCGVDQSNGVRFAFVVRAASDRVVTVALTRYMLDDAGMAFENYSGTVFDLLQLKGYGQTSGEHPRDEHAP